MSATPPVNTSKLEEISQFLLNSGLLLTALELHQELLEDGVEISVLKKKFDSQPESSKKPSNQDQSNETTTISSAQKDALLKERDELKERLLQVQTDLRTAKDTINSLKYQLSKQQNAPKSGVSFQNAPDINSISVQNKDGTDTVEVRALNYLIRRFLVEHSFKLTAISFDQEAQDQDLSDWTSVGLNTPEPPNLVTFYRQFYKAPVQSSIPLGKAMDSQKEDSKAKPESHPKMPTIPQMVFESKPEGPTIKFNAGYKRMRLNYSKVAPKAEFGDVPPEEAENHARITQELIKVVSLSKDEQSLVRIVGESLPYIVPGVILKKREELIPLTISVINKHPEKGTRFALTQLLFNLTKKPTEVERKMIVDGFIALAKIIGEERTETELLPQCWEEIGHKHPERRVLVADTCGALAMYVRSELRPSLILSILQQLNMDKAPMVREAVARNLGLLISLFEGDDKYSQIEELLFQLLYDAEFEVRTAAIKHTLPFMSDWADMIGVLCTRLVTKFFNDISTIISKPNFGTANVEVDSAKLNTLFTGLIALLPRLSESVLLGGPFAASALNLTENSIIEDVLNQQQQKLLIAKFTDLIAKDPGAKWPEFDWVMEKFIPRLIELVAKVDVSNGQTIQGFVNVLSKTCAIFGTTFTSFVIRRLFQPELDKVKKEEQSTRGKILPIYIGILAGSDMPDFVPSLKELIVSMATQERGWLREQIPILKDSLRMICKSTSKTPQVLNLLWELIVHPANHVRSCIAILFNGIIPVLNPDEVVKKVLPALVTFSSDPDKTVRFSSLQALGNVAINVEDAQILEKIQVQFTSYLDDDSHATRYEVVKIFTRMIPTVQSRFRDQFILPKLVHLAQKNHQHKVVPERNQLTQLLFESFRAFNGCLIDEDAIRDHIVPGLKILLSDAETLDPSYKSLIQSMITDMEAAISDEGGKPSLAKQASVQPSQGSSYSWSFGLGNLGMDKLKNMTTRKN